MSILNLMEGNELFTGLSNESLGKIENVARTSYHKKDGLIFSEGDAGEALMIIKRGRVKITREFSNGTGSLCLAFLEEQDVFGEMALIDIAPRSATATALEDTELIEIYQDDINMLLAGENGIQFLPLIVNISRSLSQKLRRANTLISDIAQYLNAYSF